MSAVMIFALLLISVLVVQAQTPEIIKFECSPEDIDAFGLNCTDDMPCQVFVEFTSAEAVGNKLFLAGNLHTSNATLFSLLLASEDGGLSWTEPTPRQRNVAFEQVLFFDSDTGWISGQSIDPLPRNQFVMLSTDGGRTWRQKFLFEDPKFGAITQMRFDSRTSGELVLDASQGRNIRQELYGTMTGGEGWEVKQTSNKQLSLKSRPTPSPLRVRSDAKTDTHLLERRTAKGWDLITVFPVRVAECK